MTSLPAAIGAQMAMTQQNAAMSMIKSSAQADRSIANILMEAAESVPTGSRGGRVNITA